MLKVIGQSVFEGKNPRYKFAAVDPDGECYLFVEGSQPIVSYRLNCWIMGSPPFDCYAVGNGFCTENWKGSLITKEGFSEKYEPEQGINTIEVRIDSN